MKDWCAIPRSLDKVRKVPSRYSRVQKRFSFINIESNFLSLALTVLLIASCSGSDSSPVPPNNDYTAFGTPQLVTINSYPGEDAMEPFISRRDGSFLFFNDNASNTPEKDIFYATFVSGTTFMNQGRISAINSAKVDGVPTLDIYDKFYFVSLATFDGSTNFDTLYCGIWNGSTVTDVAPVGLTLNDPFFLYFDIEVNRGGDTLYLSAGAFPLGSTFPTAADIYIAVDSGSGFVVNSTASNSFMANVNTTDNLEYASAISRDGLELFFTRSDPVTLQARIYRSVRASTGAPFGAPQMVSAITGFVEGPAFSPDEKSLYYHRKNPATEKYEIYRVTRP